MICRFFLRRHFGDGLGERNGVERHGGFFWWTVDSGSGAKEVSLSLELACRTLASVLTGLSHSEPLALRTISSQANQLARWRSCDSYALPHWCKSERSSTNHRAQRQQLLESGQWSFKKNHTSLIPTGHLEIRAPITVGVGWFVVTDVRCDWWSSSLFLQRFIFRKQSRNAMRLIWNINKDLNVCVTSLVVKMQCDGRFISRFPGWASVRLIYFSFFFKEDNCGIF